MEHRSFAPDIVVPNDDYACGNKRAGELAPDVAPEELRQEKQVGGPVNCSDSELCIFLLALEAGFLPTYYSDTNQSVQLKSMSIASKSYRRGKQTVLFHGFPSLRMSQNLMDDHGEALLMWFLEASRARTSVWLGRVTDSMASAPAFGQRWLGSLAKYDHDSRSWRTPQLSLAGDLGVYSETWPRWGWMRDGECWERTTPELPTCATEFGLWPTPCATDNSDRKPFASMHETKRGTFKHKAANGVLSQVRLSQVVRHKSPPSDGRLNPEWVEWLMGWPIGQTALKPLETDKFREWQQQHGPC